MKLDTYALKADGSLTVFEFISEGPKGLIRKAVQFQETNQSNLYNLAFGDKDPTTGDIDDFVVSDNGDSEKVLATVVSAVYAFLINTQTRSFTLREARKHGHAFIAWESTAFTVK